VKGVWEARKARQARSLTGLPRQKEAAATNARKATPTESVHHKTARELRRQGEQRFVARRSDVTSSVMIRNRSRSDP
jgi:hypothetical protein